MPHLIFDDTVNSRETPNNAVTIKGDSIINVMHHDSIIIPKPLKNDKKFNDLIQTGKKFTFCFENRHFQSLLQTFVK